MMGWTFGGPRLDHEWACDRPGRKKGPQTVHELQTTNDDGGGCPGPFCLIAVAFVAWRISDPRIHMLQSGHQLRNGSKLENRS